ncbi:SpoIIE family protein phosphatase [Streptomyces sp. NPDC047706]|uniref:SpoIIE family protein phosphatase n=1 Tax=Streptomyces sp. NPDC047706 TaxID=3365486 RepID=UPI003714B55C
MPRTTIAADRVTLGEQIHASDLSDTAFALLDEQGTVVAWTRAAEHLVGHSAREMAGRPAALVLPCMSAAQTMSAYVEQCRARNGWSGAPAVRHRDGRVLPAGLRITSVRGQDGAVRWLVSATDVGVPTADPLGMVLGITFEDMELELPEGTLLAFCTDGMAETRGQDIGEGMQRPAIAPEQPDLPPDDLATRAMEPVQAQAACDDAGLLLVRTRALAPVQVAGWALPPDETAARRARDLAAGQLAAWGMEALEDSTKSIISELVANAVRHGTGPIGLRLIQHQALTIEVSDSDPRCPHRRSARTTDENGRGLAMVARLSRRWGSRPVPGGKVVWAEASLA